MRMLLQRLLVFQLVRGAVCAADEAAAPSAPVEDVLLPGLLSSAQGCAVCEAVARVMYAAQTKHFVGWSPGDEIVALNSNSVCVLAAFDGYTAVEGDEGVVQLAKLANPAVGERSTEAVEMEWTNPTAMRLVSKCRAIVEHGFGSFLGRVAEETLEEYLQFVCVKVARACPNEAGFVADLAKHTEPEDFAYKNLKSGANNVMIQGLLAAVEPLFGGP